MGRTALTVYRADIKIPALILSPLFGNLIRGKKMEVRTKNAEEIIQKKLDDLSRKNRYQGIISVVTQNVHQSIDLQMF